MFESVASTQRRRERRDKRRENTRESAEKSRESSEKSRERLISNRSLTVAARMDAEVRRPSFARMDRPGGLSY